MQIRRRKNIMKKFNNIIKAGEHVTNQKTSKEVALICLLYGLAREIEMKLNTLVKLPDGRIGTICYNHLDGAGGVWGEHHFEMPEGGFSDDLPEPDFMLREKKVEELLKGGSMGGHKSTMECVGEDYEIIENANANSV